MEDLDNLNKQPFSENIEIKQNPKHSLLFKILLIVFIVTTIVLLIIVIIMAVRNKNNEEKNEEKIPEKNENSEELIKAYAGKTESWNELFGIKLENLSYIEGDKMENSFKNNSRNYNPEIGNINNGEDYMKNEHNKYTLYIPEDALNKKNKYNGILLFLHAKDEKKEDMEYLCSRYAKHGYITASMDYTELMKNISNSNVFRIMDEITSCLKSIQKTLSSEKYKFDATKLELGLGGFSLGAYYAMLYGYSMKNVSPIPIKFIINICGILDFEPNNWLFIYKFNSTLSDLDPNSIDEGMKNGTITKYKMTEGFYLIHMDGWLGYRYTEAELYKMLKEDKISINYDNKEYQALYNSSKHFYVSYHLNKTKENDFIPILCEYAGNDTVIGVGNFKFLRQIQQANKNFNLDLVYMRYANHFLISYNTENGKQAMKDMNSMILKYAKTYFKSENYEEEQKQKNFEEGGRAESWNILYGIKLENISYAQNGIIVNSFKEGGINYNEEIGIIYEGKDYKSNNLNVYNLYIPVSALDKKDKYNGIIMFLHGSGLHKEDMDYFSARYAKQGYITATMDFNQVNSSEPHSNKLRMIDEITSCISNIKKLLKEEYKFNENKLELALGGYSLGGVLTLLYGYSMEKKSPIPIKFLINLAGALDIDRNYLKKVAKNNVTLSDIEPESIDLGIKNGTIIDNFPNDSSILYQLNNDIGHRYSNNIIKQMLDENDNINSTNEYYKEFYKSYKYLYTSYYINRTGDNGGNIIPVLSEYGGNDVGAGVGQFQLLRKLSNKYKFPIDLVYMRYATHSLMDPKTENGIKAMQDLHSMILKYAKTYFTTEN